MTFDIGISHLLKSRGHCYWGDWCFLNMQFNHNDDVNRAGSVSGVY